MPTSSPPRPKSQLNGSSATTNAARSHLLIICLSGPDANKPLCIMLCTIHLTPSILLQLSRLMPPKTGQSIRPPPHMAPQCVQRPPCSRSLFLRLRPMHAALQRSHRLRHASPPPVHAAAEPSRPRAGRSCPHWCCSCCALCSCPQAPRPRHAARHGRCAWGGAGGAHKPPFCLLARAAGGTCAGGWRPGGERCGGEGPGRGCVWGPSIEGI